jgi:replicative DNA helicase
MSTQSIGAERAVLSIIMRNPDLYFTVSDLISESDFTVTGNGRIFTAIKSILTRGLKEMSTIDRYLIFAEAERMNMEDFFHHTLNGDLVEALEKTPHNKEHFLGFVSTLKQSTIKRALINTFDELKDQVANYSGASIELRNLVEERVLGAVGNLDSDKGDTVALGDDFEDVINSYADNPSIGVDIGFPRWQKDIGKIKNGSMTGVFARAKAGKSQLAMWAAFQAAIKRGIPVLYLDTELQAREQQMRLCGMMSKIDYELIESGKWKSNPTMVETIKSAFAEIKKSNKLFYKNIAGQSVQYVIPAIRKFVQQQCGGPIVGNDPKCLVIYDYIKLMSSDDIDRVQEHQLLGLLTSSLHDCVAKLNIPMIVLGQLNRDGFKVDSELAVAGADRIVHNLDSFTILRKKKPEEIEEDGKMRGNALLKVCIARHGAGHDDPYEWINLHFDKGAGQFREDKRNSEVVPVVKRLEEGNIENFAEARN